MLCVFVCVAAPSCGVDRPMVQGLPTPDSVYIPSQCGVRWCYRASTNRGDTLQCFQAVLISQGHFSRRRRTEGPLWRRRGRQHW